MDKNEKIALGILGVAAAGIIGYKYLVKAKKTTTTTKQESSTETIPTTTTTQTSSTVSSPPSTTTSTTTTQTYTPPSTSTYTPPTTTTTTQTYTPPSTSTYTPPTTTTTTQTYTPPSSTTSTTTPTSTTTTSTTTGTQQGYTVTLKNNCNQAITVVYTAPDLSSKTITIQPGGSATVTVAANVQKQLLWYVNNQPYQAGVTQNGQTVYLCSTQTTQQPGYTVTLVNNCNQTASVYYVDTEGKWKGFDMKPGTSATITVDAKVQNQINWWLGTTPYQAGVTQNGQTIKLCSEYGSVTVTFTSRCAVPQYIIYTDPRGFPGSIKLGTNETKSIQIAKGTRVRVEAEAAGAKTQVYGPFNQNTSVTLCNNNYLVKICNTCSHSMIVATEEDCLGSLNNETTISSGSCADIAVWPGYNIAVFDGITKEQVDLISVKGDQTISIGCKPSIQNATVTIVNNCNTKAFVSYLIAGTNPNMLSCYWYAIKQSKQVWIQPGQSLQIQTPVGSEVDVALEYHGWKKFTVNGNMTYYVCGSQSGGGGGHGTGGTSTQYYTVTLENQCDTAQTVQYTDPNDSVQTAYVSSHSSATIHVKPNTYIYLLLSGGARRPFGPITSNRSIVICQGTTGGGVSSYRVTLYNGCSYSVSATYTAPGGSVQTAYVHPYGSTIVTVAANSYITSNGQRFGPVTSDAFYTICKPTVHTKPTPHPTPQPIIHPQPVTTVTTHPTSTTTITTVKTTTTGQRLPITTIKSTSTKSPGTTIITSEGGIRRFIYAK